MDLTWRDFDPALFLADYWQRKPLLIRRAFAAWDSPLEPNELAGLACEEDAEARLVIHDPQSDQWTLEHGPLPESRFGTLPRSHWTLLVQAVDQWVPEVADLLEPFRFLPNWRIDDVMVSYAADQGSVGPHVDQYDVFLIQGLGKRRWQVGRQLPADAPLRDGIPLRQLASFEPIEEWLLEPGDILYLPPGYAHHGAAEGDDCMTYSVGFRAPSRSELVAHWAGQALSELDEDDRFRDPAEALATSRTESPGRIDTSAIELAHHMVLDTLSDPEQFARWFGSHVTAPKYPELLAEPDPLKPRTLRPLARSYGLAWMPGSRFAYIDRPDGAWLFVDGEMHDCPGALAGLARLIAARLSIDATDLAPWLDQPAALELLCVLHNQGSLSIEDGD